MANTLRRRGLGATRAKDRSDIGGRWGNPRYFSQRKQGRWRQRAALVAFLAWLATGLASHAHAAGHGTITGVVQNGTAGAALPNGLVVVLETFRNTLPVGSQTVTVGADGRFAFSGLAAGPNDVYLVRTTHAGVVYGTDLIRLADDGMADTALTVYEVTNDDPGVARRTATRFLKRRSSAVVSILEIAELQVPGDRTFVPVARQGMPPIRFGLPPAAFNLEALGGFGTEEAVVGGPGFAVYAPLRPGIATIAFGFDVALAGAEGALSWTMTAPVETVRLLSEVEGLDVRVTGLADMGLDQVGATVVRRWEGQRLAHGAEIGIQVTDTSMPGLLRALRATTADRWAMILGGVGLAGAAALAIWRRSWRRLAPDPVARADALAAEMTTLDGSSGTDERRAALKHELLDLAARHPAVRAHMQSATRSGGGEPS